MYSFIFLASLVASSWAQYPLGPDIKQLGLTFQFDQFISLLQSNPLTSAILTGPSKVTIIVPFNIPIDTFLPRLEAGPSTEASRAAIANVENPNNLSNLLRYLILKGTHPAASLASGWSFLPSSLDDPKMFPLSKPATLGVFSDATNFFIRSGNNFTSNVMIKVCHLYFLHGKFLPNLKGPNIRLGYPVQQRPHPRRRLPSRPASQRLRYRSWYRQSFPPSTRTRHSCR